MSNVAMEFDYKQSAEMWKDEEGDGLHTPGYGENASDLDDLQRVSHGNHLSSKKARHDGPNEHADLSNTKGMHEAHLDGLHRAQLDDLSIVAEAHGNGNAVIGRSACEIGSSSSFASLSESPTYVTTHVPRSVESVPASHKHATSAAFGILGEPQYENIAASETHVNSTTDGTSTKQYSMSLEADDGSQDDVDGATAHDSPVKQPHASHGEELYNGTMHGTSEEHIHVASGDIPKTTTVFGWHAGRDGVASPNSYMAGTHVVKPPYEALPANGNVGRYAQQRTSLHSPFLNAFKEAFENYDKRGNVFNYRTSDNGVETYVHEKPSSHNEPGGDDLKVNIEHMQAPSLTTKKGSVFSGSLYDTAQSGYMKNLTLILRFGVAIFSLIAFSVMISNNEKRVAAGSTFYVKFSDYQAYNYLVALNLLTFLYSGGHLVLLAQARASRILSSPVKWGASIYLCDQMLAFLMVSSSSSAATASELSRNGLHNIWPPACSTWKLSLFCSRADVAVAMSFVSCFFMFLSTFSSGYRLSNLLAE